jgi:hypothetical protein
MKGLWIWIWELPKCDGGSARAIAARAKRCGVAGVIVKVGEDGPVPEQLSSAFVQELAAGGVACAAWWYCRPRALEAQIAMLEVIRDRGITAFVLDAESEWDSPDQRPLAKTFATNLRAALGPDVFLADAPWARPIKHRAPFPYAEFGSVMDARMPQFYWKLAEEGGEPCDRFLADCDLEWAQTAPGALICPTLSTLNRDGTQHAPVSELAWALDRYAARQAVSLWSYQHLSVAEWAFLEERAAAAPPLAPPLA